MGDAKYILKVAFILPEGRCSESSEPRARRFWIAARKHSCSQALFVDCRPSRGVCQNGIWYQSTPWWAWELLLASFIIKFGKPYSTAVLLHTPNLYSQVSQVFLLHGLLGTCGLCCLLNIELGVLGLPMLIANTRRWHRHGSWFVARIIRSVKSGVKLQSISILIVALLKGNFCQRVLCVIWQLLLDVPVGNVWLYFNTFAGVRSYKRPNEDMEEQLSNLLYGDAASTTTEEKTVGACQPEVGQTISYTNCVFNINRNWNCAHWIFRKHPNVS